jgi:exosortase
MINLLAWILAALLYLPLFLKLYTPIWNGLLAGPVPFLKSFGAPWGRVADYTHAYFILPITLWLIWRNREQLKSRAGKGSFATGLLLLLVGLLMLVFGLRQNYIFVSTFSLIPFLAGLVMLLYGRDAIKTAGFPILYLIFLVPPPGAVLDAITLPLREWVSALAESILGILNYPISRDGLLLTIGYNDIYMGQPCSGFRSLVTMFALILIYVYLSKRKILHKVLLAASIVPFAILGNIIRVIALCLITFYFGEDAGQGFFHDFSGIVVFTITLLGILGVDNIMEKKLRSS